MFLLDELGFVEGALRTLCAWLCQVIYPIIAAIFQLFIDVASIRLQLPIETLFRRVTMMLTIIMTFYIIFEFIKYIVQPDTIGDKEKGVGKIGAKIVIVIVLLAFVPDIFTYAWKLQNSLVKSGAISKIILGRGNTDGTYRGNNFAAEMLNTFYDYRTDYWDADGPQSCEIGLDCKNIVNWNIQTLKDTGTIPNLTLGLNAATKDAESTLVGDKSKVALIDFNGFLAVGVGLFIGYILILYTVDVAARVFQLTYLQVIAPIPIIGYLAPKKDNMFNKWVQQCIATYLDLFIRLAIINFILLFSELLANSKRGGHGILGIPSSEVGGLIYVILTLGLLLFAQKVPKLLQELFPKMGVAGGNFGLKAGERVAPLAARVIGAGAAGTRRLVGGAIANGINAHRRNKAAYEQTGKTGKERRKDAKEARGQLKTARRNYDAAMAARNKAAKKGFGSDEYKAAQEKFKSARDALTEKKSDYADKMAAKNKSVVGNAITGGLAGAGRGIRTGFGATKAEDIGKKVREATTADKKAIAAKEQWLDSGGYSRADRIASGIDQRLGLTTAAQLAEREIKSEETQIKRRQALMQTEKDVGTKADAAKDSIKSRQVSGKDKVIVKGDRDGHKTYEYTKANGKKGSYTVDVGEGKTTSEIIAKATAGVSSLEASSEAAQAEAEKMRAKKASSAEWSEEQQAALIAKREAVKGKKMWTSGQEQQLQEVKTKKELLEKQSAGIFGRARHEAEIAAYQAQEDELQAAKEASCTEEQMQQLSAMEAQRKTSWYEEEDGKLLKELDKAAEEKAEKANEAKNDLERIKDAIAEDVFTQVLGYVSDGKTPPTEQYHPSYVNAVQEALESAREAARDSETLTRVEKLIEDKYPFDPLHPEKDADVIKERTAVIEEFKAGKFTTWKHLDDVKAILNDLVKEKAIEISEHQGTKARLEASSQHAADKANDTASKPGS